MKVIVEGYDYPLNLVKEILCDFDLHPDRNNKVRTDYVGYLYNPNLPSDKGIGYGDCVFILPKVVLDVNDKVFGHIDPLDLIEVEKCTSLKNNERKFLYEFVVWIYRAISVYNLSMPDNKIVYEKKQLIKSAGFSRKVKSETFLDVLISICKFNRENKDFFMTILKNLHSGYNKINWNKTVSKSTAIVQGKSPVYTNPINKKRLINFDEELLVIFFSILNFIKEEYGFPVTINLGYELITGNRFKSYINGYGAQRLKQIKYKFFSDKALQLWNLCFAFFEHSHPIFSERNGEEYLLVKNFNIVFEAMIDELIGDKEGLVPSELKNQQDGKIVDHIFKWDSLTKVGNVDQRVFYVGDSKYYKLGNSLGTESIYKQYTYARNIIQWNLNLFLSDNEKEKKKHKKYRDDITEGYDIIPNFFISALMDEGLTFRDYIAPTDKHGEGQYFQRQFENRLFDRDTLLISHYDVNFLHVISLYARQNESQKALWRKKVREIFREEIRKILIEQYHFYAMEPKPGPMPLEYIQKNFKKILGKIYRPYDEENIFSLALDKKDNDPEVKNADLITELEKYFYIAPLHSLSDDPLGAIGSKKTTKKSEGSFAFDSNLPNVLTGYVGKNEINYKYFKKHRAKTYLMHSIPSVNIMAVKYFMPLVEGYIDGYYTVIEVKFVTYKEEDNPQITKTSLRLSLGDFVKFGEEPVFVFKDQIPHGSLITIDKCLELYQH